MLKFLGYIYKHWRLFIDSTKNCWYWPIFMEIIWKYIRGPIYHHSLLDQRHHYNHVQ